MTRKVEFPDLVIPMSDLNREHMSKIVVYDEHTLGIWYPERPDEVRTLVSDPARGARTEHRVFCQITPESTIRLASSRDFVAFRVVNVDRLLLGDLEYHKPYRDDTTSCVDLRFHLDQSWSEYTRGAVCDELVVEDLVPSSIRKEGIHQIDVQHLFG